MPDSMWLRTGLRIAGLGDVLACAHHHFDLAQLVDDLLRGIYLLDYLPAPFSKLNVESVNLVQKSSTSCLVHRPYLIPVNNATQGQRVLPKS